MSSDNTAIRVEGLSKCFHIYDHPGDRLKQFIIPSLLRLITKRPKIYFREFWALKEVYFEVKKGETVGIVGRNGSGKSTLLQIICGTLSPTEGKVDTYGRIAALLELGSGFNPEFTGRENVYMNAAVLGLSKEEVDTCFEDIIIFAEVGEFIDQPVKTYSSGMVVRLAFAVIVHVNADILVIDEALAVGDTFFQQKCMRFLREYQNKGGTILFVSHDTTTVLNLCNKSLLLFSDKTCLPIFGETENLIKLYLEELYSDQVKDLNPYRENKIESGVSFERINPHKSFEGDLSPGTVYSVSDFRIKAENFGEEGVEIIDTGFFDYNDCRLSKMEAEDSVYFKIKAKVHRRILWPAFGFMLKNTLGEYLYAEGTDKHFRNHNLVFEEGDIVLATFTFMVPHLIQGHYFVNVAISEGIDDDHIQQHWIYDALQIDVLSSRLVHGYCGMNNMKMSIEVFSRDKE